MRTIAIVVALFAAPLSAQLSANLSSEIAGPGGGDRTVACDECPTTGAGLRGTRSIPAGSTVTDSTGLTVTVSGSGSIRINGTGTCSPSGAGSYTVSGTITDIDNPRSGGATRIDVTNVNGANLDINLQRTGSSPGAPVVTTVQGGSCANVNITVGSSSGSSTQNNEVMSNGGSVTFENRAQNNIARAGVGRSSSSGQGTTGTVYMGGTGNVFYSQGGSWTIR